MGSWRFLLPVWVPADAAWRRVGPSTRSRRSCPTLRGADLDGDHREHGAVAAAPADGPNQQMRWSPREAYLTLKVKVRTTVVNGTFNQDHTTAERRARRPFHKAA